MKMVMDSLRLSGQAGGVCVAEMEVVLQMSLFTSGANRSYSQAGMSVKPCKISLHRLALNPDRQSLLTFTARWNNSLDVRLQKGICVLP